MNKLILFTLFIFILSSCSKSLSDKEKKTYTNQGKEIAQATQKTLGTNLMQKMKKGGVQAAIPFCNSMANPLTEEMSKKYDVEIKRTSDKIRNESNGSTLQESEVIKQYKNLLSNKKDLTPMVKLDKSGKPHFYAPILMQKKCLACHGTIGKSITKQADSIIKTFYPNDIATGYNEGDLRGVWSITFNTK